MRRLIYTMISLLLPLALMAENFRAVVIPVEFSDLTFSDHQSATEAKISTATSFFNDQFHPERTFSFEVLPTVRLKKIYSWYGANSSTMRDMRCGELIRDVAAAVSADLSVYDNDGDGVIDNIYILAAGPSEAEGGGADLLWPQQGFMSAHGGRFTHSGCFVDSFSICTEFASPAIFCHEFGHVFGLPDLYDTDGADGSGTARGLWGKLSPMDLGAGDSPGRLPANFSAIDLEMLGIGNRIPFSRGFVRLQPISSGKQYVRINSDTDDEYYLLECRKAEGWDKDIDGGGLVIYHVDRSDNNAWYSDLYKRNLTARERWSLNQVNCRPDHQCAYVVSAIPGASSLKDAFFPQQGRTFFSSDTDPSFRFWNGATSRFALDRITLAGDGSVSFYILTPITVLSSQVFQDAIIINWVTDSEMDVNLCNISWYDENSPGDGTANSVQVRPQDDGSFYYIIEGLKPSSNYSIRIQAISTSGSAFSNNLRLSTKGKQKGAYPFIYLNSSSRNEDGTFKSGEPLPLRVYNLENAETVLWYFNNMRIFPGSDGYWHPESNGTLKAEIWYSDGTMEIITKRISIR